MPGSGKSTVGKPLANSLKIPFLDLDHIIEAQEGAAVREIFSTKGEAYFRGLEEHYLKQTTSTNLDFILSTGGGTPCFSENIDFMLAQGKVIFLDVEMADLITRFQKEGLEMRPLLKDYTTRATLQTYLEDLYGKRKPYYDRANFKVKISRQSPLELVEIIISNLEVKP